MKTHTFEKSILRLEFCYDKINKVKNGGIVWKIDSKT